VITHLGKETWLSATATDLSSDGLSLSLSDSLNSGESVYLLASVKPEGQAPRDLSVNGVTSYCRPQDNGQWRVGIRFIDLTPDEKASWKEFLGL
jgi:hypothetical protein